MASMLPLHVDTTTKDTKEVAPPAGLLRLRFTEASLGLSLVLAVREGRRLVVVDKTHPERGGGVAAALRPQDELVAFEDGARLEHIHDLDVDGFEALLARLRAAPRPLVLVFARREQKKLLVKTGPRPSSTRRRKRGTDAVAKAAGNTTKKHCCQSSFLLFCHLVAVVLADFFRRLFCLWCCAVSAVAVAKETDSSKATFDDNESPLLRHSSLDKRNLRLSWTRRSFSEPLIEDSPHLCDAIV